MSYEETLDYLYAATPAFHQVGREAYKPGFENTMRLMEHLDNPHLRFRSVHVAGTNGKGSTSHMLAAVLQSAGYKTGLYTSPHLVDYRERIRVNGEMIARERVVELVEENKAFIEDVKPSFFEITMALAFQYFAEEKVDIAVVEVGLGGRLDSTNIITPEVSVITNIGLDHTEFLGDTLAKIAGEKAGIIKEEVPVVIGEYNEETQLVFEQAAHLRRAPLIRAYERSFPDYACQLKGSYQQKNIRTVLTAINVLRDRGYVIIEAAVEQGLAKVCDLTGLQGRWQEVVVKKNQSSACLRVILDTGHNSHGVRSYIADLRQIQSLHVVFGMVADKDVEDVLQLLPKKARYYWTQAQTKRAIPATEMQRLGRNYGLQGEAYSSVCEAIAAAMNSAAAEDTIFIGGSNYVVGEGMKCLSQ